METGSRSKIRFLVRFEDDAAIHPDLVGNKFASLARAYRHGFSVPTAVAIRVEAHHFFLSKTGNGPQD